MSANDNMQNQFPQQLPPTEPGAGPQTLQQPAPGLPQQPPQQAQGPQQGPQQPPQGPPMPQAPQPMRQAAPQGPQQGPPQQPVYVGVLPAQAGFYYDKGAPRPAGNFLENKKSDERRNLCAAGAIIRLVSWCIDVIVVKALTNIVTAPIFSLFGISFAEGFFKPYSVVYAIIYYGYFVLMTYFADGATLGKKITGLKVCGRKDDSNPDIFAVLTRELFMRYVQNRFWLLYIIISFTPMRQSLGDIMADTYVKRLVREEAFKSGMEYAEMRRMSVTPGSSEQGAPQA